MKARQDHNAKHYDLLGEIPGHISVALLPEQAILADYPEEGQRYMDAF